MKKLIMSLLVLLGTCFVQAQNSITVKTKDGKEHVIDFPNGMQSDMDSLYWDWQSKYCLFVATDCDVSTPNPVISDSIYIDRLSRIPTSMELPFNEVVKKFIESYTNRLRKKVSFALACNNFYIPIFEEALDVYGLPLELKYLPIIESSLNPTAVSRQGATGLWQFMLRTGKIYGLESNSLVDDRRDPVKSTWAAVRYLKDLYDIYKDWNLVLAAYNCGPGNINKAIRRADGEADYWSIYNYLPRETRGYVPGFIATTYIMNYYCDHGIYPMESKLPAATDTLLLHKNLHLQQVADVCQIDIEQLRCLNPQYKRDLIPADETLRSLRLPSHKISNFLASEDSIYAYKAEKYLNKRKIVAIKEVKEQYHRIRNGENLGSIAARYHVSVKQLRQLNHLKGNNIRAGRTLRIR